MITPGAVMHFSPAQLFEHLGVTLGLDVAAGDDREVLVVRFATGEQEYWTPAPDGYPLDGSLEFIEYRGRYFVPLDRGDSEAEQ